MVATADGTGRHDLIWLSPAGRLRPHNKSAANKDANLINLVAYVAAKEEIYRQPWNHHDAIAALAGTT